MAGLSWSLGGHWLAYRVINRLLVVDFAKVQDEKYTGDSLGFGHCRGPFFDPEVLSIVPPVGVPYFFDVTFD